MGLAMVDFGKVGNSDLANRSSGLTEYWSHSMGKQLLFRIKIPAGGSS